MRLRKNQIVQVEFLDHCQNASTPMPFVVYGRLATITPQHLCIDSWAHRDKRHQHDGNVERYTILRSAITKITQLKEDTT